MSDQVDSIRRTTAEKIVDGAAVDPSTGRPAGRAQALVLLFASCLSVLGGVLLAPVLPTIQRAFAGTPGVETLTVLVLTIPALVIALTATFAGRVADRVGRKQLLIGALVVYAVVGTAPLYLPSLQLILASRVLVGLTEAVIATCCTTLLADYFHGSKRERYFGLQVVFTTVSATIFFGLGGALGSNGWRTPFWLYAVSLPLAVLAARYIWQPTAHRRAGAGGLSKLPWDQLRAPVAVTLIGAVVFYALIIELPFKLDAIGVRDPAVIGVAAAVASVGTAVGAFLFGRLARRGPALTVPLAFALSGVGLVGLALASAVPVIMVFAVITGLGNGLLLPALLIWALASLGLEQRGRGTGVWTAALCLGQFVCPLVVLALSAAISGLTSALVVLGAVSVAAAVGVRLLRPTRVDAVPSVSAAAG